MKKGRVNAKYDEAYIKENRTFPVGKTILLVVLLLVQIAMILAAFHYEPTPQDIIRQYDVTVDPQADGTLDITYHFVWEAVDTSEELTWIQIGMANQYYKVYPDSVSNTIYRYEEASQDSQVHLKLYLTLPYTGGEVVEFSFRVNQRDMLCKDENGYFYEFVPCWFNATPVENYTFRWAEDERMGERPAVRRQNGYYIWKGSLGCGEYVMMRVPYGQDSLIGCRVVPYVPFDDSGVYNSLNDDKNGMIVLAFFGAAILLGVQVWIIDSVVSYHRGRGFLTGYGYHVHTYGRSNPYYVRERDRQEAASARRSGGGRRGGGGCACACACACAGGGRAGCSQKDTYSNRERQ